MEDNKPEDEGKELENAAEAANKEVEEMEANKEAEAPPLETNKKAAAEQLGTQTELADGTMARIISEEDYREFEMLQMKQKNDLTAHKKEFDDYEIKWPEDMPSHIATIKMERLKGQAKQAVIQAWEAQKQQDVMDLNSPGLEKRMDEIKLTHKNYSRQLMHLKTQMALDKFKRTPEIQKLSGGSLIFNKEKLQLEIKGIHKRLKFYGLDPQKVLEEKFD